MLQYPFVALLAVVCLADFDMPLYGSREQVVLQSNMEGGQRIPSSLMFMRSIALQRNNAVCKNSHVVDNENKPMDKPVGAPTAGWDHEIKQYAACPDAHMLHRSPYREETLVAIATMLQ